MPYSQPFLRVVFSGTLYFTEEFSFGLSLVRIAPGTDDPPTVVPQGIIDAVTDLWADQVICGAAALTTIKVNEIGTNGRYTQDETVEYEFDPPIAGGSSSVYTPPQIAYCVSLATASRRGPAHAGRFYLPVPSRPIGNSGMLSDTERARYQTAVDTFLGEVYQSVIGYGIGVVSKIGAGAQRRVTHARYGRVLDTIRSRRESLDESYTDGEDLTDL